jgi:hypothetical protein
VTAYTVTANADSSGNAELDFAHGKGHVWWIVWQVTVQSVPFRSGARVSIFVNGQYRTSSVNGGADSAQGPPAWTLYSDDTLSAQWTGLTVGDEVILQLLYEEVPIGQYGSGFGAV